VAINLYKIGGVEMDTDPAQALKDFQLSLQRIELLSPADKSAFGTQRLRQMLLRKQATAWADLGEYAQATPLFDQALAYTQRFTTQDAQDSRALFDVVTVLDDEAAAYETAVDPVLTADAAERKIYSFREQKALTQSAADLERLLKQDPENNVWKAFLAKMRVRLGVIGTNLHTPGTSDETSRKALAVLKEMAEKDHVSPMVLDQAANAFLTAEPASLRDPSFAVSCAEREVDMSHHAMPSRLLTLAEAYRAASQIEKSRSTAREGLALLPAPKPGSPISNIRKLLENQTQLHF
jgi:tetratricopeptide (TPR) repeat protein